MTTFQPFTILTPSPILGYGYKLDDFWHAIDESKPAAIIVDAGSSDPGPYMLGSGKTLCSRDSYIRDLKPMLEACYNNAVKILISSAGGAGTNEQVDYLVNIIAEIAQAQRWKFRLATIKFKCDREFLLSKQSSGQTRPCGPGPDLTGLDITSATAIVAQMGAEPFMEALKDDSVDIIVAGRSYDPAPFAAFCIHKGVEVSPAWHMGKIIECGGLCTKPKGRSILATMHQDSFELTPVNDIEKCTPVSVAAHTMYEKTRPDQLPGPGGVLHLNAAKYVQKSDGRSVLVEGSVFVPTQHYEVKLEGANLLGYRTSFIGGIRDPILIDGIEEFLVSVRHIVADAFPAFRDEDGSRLIFHIYGKNAVMGSLETSTTIPHEIGVLGEVVAKSQSMADAIASFARTTILHGAYPGQLASGGNLASPLTPLEQQVGAVYAFNLYHLMRVEDPLALFPVELKQIGDVAGLKETRPRPALIPAARAIADNLSIDCPNGEHPLQIQTSAEGGPISIQRLASVVRSKNSGPFELTLDILFETAADFKRVQRSNVLGVDLICKLYTIQPSDILVAMFFEPALGWKCTIKRTQSQGSIGERDTFGAQQHAPLLGIMIP